MAHDASQSGSPGRFISAARVFTALTMVSRVAGLVRDKVCAYRFGNGLVWSAFSLAFMVPNLFRRLFGEGALAASLVPVLTDYETSGDPTRAQLAQKLVQAVATLLVILLGAVTVVIESLLLVLYVSGARSEHNALVLSLTALMLPYVILVCLVGLLSAVLNVRGRFAEGAAAPIILNLCIITAAALAPLAGPTGRRQIWIVAAAVLLAGVLQIALVGRALRRRGMRLAWRPDWRHPGVRQVALLMAPMVAGLAVVQLNSLMDKLIAWFLTARPDAAAYRLAGWTVPRILDEGAVATLDRAAHLYELPLGVFAIALATAIFPALSRHASQGDLTGLRRTLARGLEVSLLIAIPATAGLLLVRTELVQLILEGGAFTDRDTPRVATTMSYYALGLAAFSVQQLLVRAFYALKQVRTPVRVAVWMVALNLPLNLVLVWPLGTAGLALSTTICAFIQAGWLAGLLRRHLGRLEGRRIARSLAATLGATAVMSAGVWAVRVWAISVWGAGLAGWDARLGKLMLPVLAGGVLFYLSARALGSSALRQLTGRESAT